MLHYHARRTLFLFGGKRMFHAHDQEVNIDPSLLLASTAGEVAVSEAGQFGVSVDQLLLEPNEELDEDPWLAFVISSFEPTSTELGFTD